MLSDAALSEARNTGGTPQPPQPKVRVHVASEAKGVSGLAGRYAAALFDLADQQKALDAVAGDLAQLRGLIAESGDLRRLLKNPVLSRAAQGAALAALVQRAGLMPLVGNFVALVARNRRLGALPAMIAAFQKILADRRGEVTARVTTAQALSQEQIDALSARLRQSTGSKVALDIWIDPEIIGGLVVQIGSQLIDSSLRTKLEKMQLAMKGI